MGKRQCGKIVVKPQINPCSNPTFHKNNSAAFIIPKPVAWAWRRDNPDENGSGCLRPGEKAELVFSFANPLDSEVEIDMEPTAFNPGIAENLDPETSTDVMALQLSEQNVEVLTQEFG